jgi:UDP-glucose 4-epimerase
MGSRRAGDPAAIVAKADRISEVLGWKPRLNDLDTIVGHALAWEKRLIEYRAAS